MDIIIKKEKLLNNQRHAINFTSSVYVYKQYFSKINLRSLFAEYIVCNSKYLGFLRSQICSFPKDEFTNVPKSDFSIFKKHKYKNSLLRNINNNCNNKEKIKCLKA